MAFKMNGWQSHSDSPNKFIGKRFRKLRRRIGSGIKAGMGLMTGGLIGGAMGSRNGGGIGPEGLLGMSNTLNQVQDPNTFTPTNQYSNFSGVAFGKKKKYKK